MADAIPIAPLLPPQPPSPPGPRVGPTLFNNEGKIADLVKEAPSLFRRPDNTKISEAEKSQHQTYILLVMTLVQRFWNGNKNGPVGTYHDRQIQFDSTTKLYNEGKPYYGHNIAAIAVDSDLNVTDFDFNHSEVFKSSIEHAEARLLRRIYSLAGLTTKKTVRQHTVYTTLEPCAQCAGIMALAGTTKVVYIQRDDGTRRVTDLLYNLQPYSAEVRPITALDCGSQYGNYLDTAYERFQEQIV